MTRSCSRARTAERGFVLLAAIVLAVLYFGLMELLLLDSARELKEAQRFRARVVAAVVAENAAELAAEQMTDRMETRVETADAQGSMKARMTRAGREFTIGASAVTKGILEQKASVTVVGEIDGGKIRIAYTIHSQ